MIVSPDADNNWSVTKLLSGEVGLVPVPPAAAEPFTYHVVAEAEPVSNAVSAEAARAARLHFASFLELLLLSIFNMKLSLTECVLILEVRTPAYSH